MSQHFFNHVFKNRIDEEYYDYLIDLLSDIDRLVQTATGLPKPCAYTNGDFEKGIQLDFCGLAATTLLGIEMKNDKFEEKRVLIKKAFANLLNSNTTSKLNSKGIYIKVRFALSYLYSTFASSLIMAESAFNRPYSSNRSLEYYFNLDDFTAQQIEDSLFKERQIGSLNKIISIVENNPFLVMTKPDKSDNTLQVRFSLLPLPLCLLIVNDQSISDPYLYTQELTKDGRIKNLFYNYPLSVFNKNEEGQKAYYDYVANHFDYIWTNDLTLLCRDSTGFDIHNNTKGLTEIRKPSDIKWDQKEKRIKEYLDKHKKHYSTDIIEQWRKLQKQKIAQYVVNFEDWTIVKKEEKQNNENHNDKETKILKNTINPYNNQRLKIWITDNNRYCFELKDFENNQFNFNEKKPHKIFRVLLHYAYALKHDKTPLFHENYSAGLKFISEIASPLSNSGNCKVTYKTLLESLFDANNNYNLKIPKKNIEIPDNTFDRAQKIIFESQSGVYLFEEYPILNKSKKKFPLLWYSDADTKLFAGIKIEGK